MENNKFSLLQLTYIDLIAVYEIAIKYCFKNPYKIIYFNSKMLNNSKKKVSTLYNREVNARNIGILLKSSGRVKYIVVSNTLIHDTKVN